MVKKRNFLMHQEQCKKLLGRNQNSKWLTKHWLPARHQQTGWFLQGYIKKVFSIYGCKKVPIWINPFRCKLLSKKKQQSLSMKWDYLWYSTIHHSFLMMIWWSQVQTLQPETKFAGKPLELPWLAQKSWGQGLIPNF